MKPYNDYKESNIPWLGNVPTSWKQIRMKYLCSIMTGDHDTQERNNDGEYPFYVRSPIIERSRDFTFEGEGILMAGDGVGAGRVFHHAYGKYAIHQRVYCFHHFSDIIDPSFLYYYLKSTFPLVMDMGSAQSTVPSVRLPMIQNHCICVPEMFEQKEIVEYLDMKLKSIDSSIECANKCISEYKDLKLSLISKAVTQGINNYALKDSGIDYIGMIPEHWSIYSLGSISTKTISYGVVKLFEPDENGVKILRCSDVKDGYIITEHIRTISKQLSEEYKRTILSENDVIVNVRGTLGGCAVVPEEMSGYNIAREVARISPNQGLFNSRYIMYCILGNSFLNYRDYNLAGSIYLGINMSMLSKYKCAIPPISEQKQIVQYLDKECTKIDQQISELSDFINSLETYKQSCLYEAVTGKRKVG